MELFRPALDGLPVGNALIVLQMKCLFDYLNLRKFLDVADVAYPFVFHGANIIA